MGLFQKFCVPLTLLLYDSVGTRSSSPLLSEIKPFVTQKTHFYMSPHRNDIHFHEHTRGILTQSKKPVLTTGMIISTLACVSSQRHRDFVGNHSVQLKHATNLMRVENSSKGGSTAMKCNETDVR